MRLLRLDLHAFGPFTKHSLEFGDGAGLHVVHGANEAGKSSSLRALRQLLYGIPLQTPDNFIHPYQDLRIGGVFETADGTRLEFIRRKGRNKTLRGPDDIEVFDESQLQRSLGGVNEETFSQRFGIDYEELRRGGDSVVRGGGDLGEILFAAGAGVADLRKIQQRLEAEADGLFKAKGSTPRINDALSKLNEARKAIRETQLQTSVWVEHDRTQRMAEKRQSEIDEALTQKRTEQSRLERVFKSLPLIARFKSSQAKLAEVADATLLPESFPADRREAETNLKNAQEKEREAREEIERLEGELSRLVVPVELLEHRTAITQLHADLGSYQKAANDRPGLVADRDGARREAQRRLQDLGPAISLDEAESLRLPKARRKRIQELAGEFKALIQDQQSRESAVRDLDDAIALVQEQICQLPPQQDISDLEQTIRQAQKQGDLDSQHQSAQVQLENLREQANVERARLRLSEQSPEELEKLPVPSLETIDRFENELKDADSAVRRCKEKIDELTRENQSLQGQLDAMRLEGEVPTEADLKHTRQRRDAGWELVLQAWRDGSPGGDLVTTVFVEEFASGGDLATTFRASIDKADAIADRLRREADRVLKKAELQTDLQKCASNLEKALEEWEEAGAHRERLRRDWWSQWEAARIQPLSPREMRPWRTQQQILAKAAADIRERAADVERLQKQINSLRADLNGCLDALDLPRLPDDERLAKALDHCQEIAGRIRQDNQQREQLFRDQQDLRGRRLKVERAANDARQALDEWRRNWNEAVAAIGLDGDAKPADANSVIDTIDEILQFLAEARKLDERIIGIDSDAQRFRQSVQQLLQKVASDLLDLMETSIRRALGDLNDRLSQAEKDETKAEGWQKQLQRLRGNLTSANGTVTRWNGTLEKLCEQAGCQSPDELPQTEESSKTRRAIELDLTSVEERLVEQAAGSDIDEWIAFAEKFDADQVKANLVLLEEAVAGLESERQEVAQSIGELRTKLSWMDGSGKAADAQIQAELLLASVRSDAEEYIRWRLASVVLSRAMERFREASQGPVLSRASELFSTMTLGSCAGLRADYDDSGSAVLVGVRPGGETVSVTGMSDGTCDQLYLALRIALLESSLEGREPLPFIVDDVLIMFDDQRAAAAIQALAQLSEKTQVIFFTHHEHLIEVVSENIDNSAACVHRL